jgi:hypothetical protein
MPRKLELLQHIRHSEPQLKANTSFITTGLWTVDQMLMFVTMPRTVDSSRHVTLNLATYYTQAKHHTQLRASVQLHLLYPLHQAQKE